MPRPIRSLVAPVLSSIFTSPMTREIRRTVEEARRRVRGEPHRVHYFHEVGDPYSALTAQVVGRLAKAYDVEITPVLVPPPDDAAAPERERLAAFSRKDAADVAPWFGLDFPRVDRQPEEGAILRATEILLEATRRGAFLEAVEVVCRRLWNGESLDGVAAADVSIPRGEVDDALRDGAALRKSLGHYLGATFYYGGEWYWGVDRLPYLERRLACLGVRRAAFDEPVIDPPAPPAPSKGAAPADGLEVEFFLSLRSPYSWIAMERTFSLPERHPVKVVVRPVLPMVMRGLPVPREKRFYIMLDTAREAAELGVPFGKVCDPLGRPIERAFSLLPWAREQGRERELLVEFARAVWSEGIDCCTDDGLATVVRRAGLSWEEAARNHLEKPGWEAELEKNREALFAMGLWGVPSYRLTGGGEAPFVTWGQDRIWLLEHEIRRRIESS